LILGDGGIAAVPISSWIPSALSKPTIFSALFERFARNPYNL
jgi:hypothetical protein